MTSKLDLEEIRQEIDHIDDELLGLLNKRMKYVKQVGDLKKNEGSVIYRPEREISILDRLNRLNDGLLSKPAIEAIFMEIFAASRNLELPENVSFLGPEATFSHQAAEKRFGAMSKYLPLRTIESVFEAVNKDVARYGVIPIENNQEGVVSETLDQLNIYDLKIVAEEPLPIHFAFASKQDNMKKIKRIYSKDIAFGQCKRFIDNIFDRDDVELIPVSSTSKAVKIALEEEDSAAICAHIAAKLYGLPIIYDSIEDSENNFTRFLIIGKDFINKESGNDKTTILANLPHEAGSLVTFLQDFYNEGISLNKIESRPAKEGKDFQYWFLIDFEGHFNDVNVRNVLSKHEKHIKVLGSYPKLC